MITISVITSFYKMDRYVNHFLRNVEEQNSFLKKIELVICLNEPSKFVLEQCNYFKKKYPNNIKIIIPKKLTKLGESWNLCIRKSRGKWKE